MALGRFGSGPRFQPPEDARHHAYRHEQAQDHPTLHHARQTNDRRRRPQRRARARPPPLCRSPQGTTKERADEAFRNLRSAFFDWNEVRVSMAREVEDALAGLPRADEKAQRLISLLQEIFETTYSFDLEGLHKKGLKLAEKQLERYQGANSFVVAYVLANGLGGHALPLDGDMERTLRRLELFDGEADLAAQRASLEHQVPKAKGATFCANLSVIAQEFCTERQPQCAACPCNEDCPSAAKHLHNGKRTAKERAPARARAK